MAAAAPMLYFSGTTGDVDFVAGLAKQLQLRGLSVVAGRELSARPDCDALLGRSAVCCVVVSPPSVASPTVRAEYQTALSQGKPVIPLIAHSRGDLSPELAARQWIDFSQSAFTGWLDLVMTLDLMGLARFPTPQIAFLDWDLALARAYRGRMPYGWRAYRADSRHPDAGGSDGEGGGDGALVTNRSEIVIVTPEGFGVRAREQAIICQYAAVADIQVATIWGGGAEAGGGAGGGGMSDGRVALRVTYRGGHAASDIPIEPGFTPGMVICDQIIAQLWAFQRRQPATQADGDAAVASRIFISHARKDAAEVDLLDEALERQGWQTWVDRNMLTGGQEWSQELGKAIEECAALVVCVSPASMASPVVRQEYEYALRLGKPVLGVWLEAGADAPPELRERMCGDFSRGVARSLRAGLCPLALALERAQVRPTAAGTGTATAADFNALLALGQALTGMVPEGWHVFTPEGSPADAAQSQAQRLIVTTPEGFVTQVDAGSVRAYPYASFDAVQAGPPPGSGLPASAGGVTLSLAATGRTEWFAPGPEFAHPAAIAEQILSDFSRYAAAHAPQSR